MSVDLSWLASEPGRCPRCWLHVESQGHARTMPDGSESGCTPSGPLGLLLARDLADDAMARTIEAHPSAVSLIESVIDRHIRARRPFSANTIRAELRSLAPDERPAIGACINSARSRMRKIGEEPSTDPATHGKAVSIWVAKEAA